MDRRRLLPILRFFPKILESLSTLPREHLAAVGCAKNLANQSDCSYIRIALRALKVSYSDVGEGGVAVNCEKKPQFFLNTLYMGPVNPNRTLTLI